MDQLGTIRPEEGECITSYDVKALLTFDPVDSATTIIKHKLQQGTQLHHKTPMSKHHIITVLGFILKNKYFLFQDKYYEQVHNAAMGSPISPL